jgi:single-strand DNA-binding protein
MAAFNKVILIGRLTRDPECRTFSTGGKVAKFGFAVTNRKKNSQTGQWEDEPMFIDCEAFNRGEFGTLANTIETYCRKGSQICIEGKLHLDTWDDKTTGQKRQKHKIIVDSMQLLDARQDGQGGQRAMAGAGAPAGRPAASADHGDEPQGGGAGEDIPF